ncbi:hypothetical protein MA16_Dca010312 [Dendrobium catenatum]|uniref:Uncharacterized protein n=1 Tax=Dendrobium catenatum TaxID=906689 RepID=A0A2I0W3F1_9ASPA|nr:hypothetical protein MA16_Dca010312 [Dendrobium catenatum]
MSQAEQHRGASDPSHSQRAPFSASDQIVVTSGPTAGNVGGAESDTNKGTGEAFQREKITSLQASFPSLLTIKMA